MVGTVQRGQNDVVQTRRRGWILARFHVKHPAASGIFMLVNCRAADTGSFPDTESREDFPQEVVGREVAGDGRQCFLG